MASTEQIILTGKSRRAIERMNAAKGIRIEMSGEADQTTRKIARAYGKAWKVVRRTTKEMADHAAEQMHAGRGLSARDIARLDRVDRALHVLERQVRTLNDYTGVQVKGAANATVEHTVDAVLDVLATQTGVDRHFTKPAGAAMEGLILRSTGRIESTARRLDATQATALKDSLMRGLVLGENPRDTARHIMRETEGTFFGGLSRATNLARTEIADAHRFASRIAYGESELVVGWKWLAQLSSRTCPACWSMHNTLHEKTEMQFGHQSCRCTMVPVLADDDPADIDLGDPEQIFWDLPREDQLKIMGPGRLKALEAGAAFTDLTFLKRNGNWRPSQHVTSVADLSGIAELQVATFPGDVISVPGLTNSSIMSYAFAQGGLTINTLTGDQPTTGFVVARQGTSAVIDAREFFGPAGPTQVAAWLTQHGDALDEPGADMGMWYDTANGKVVLDVVQILDDREAAIALGRAEDQIAIFDLDTFSEISTGGTGGYATPEGGFTNSLSGVGMKGSGLGTGTPDDPINVKGDVLLAAKLIGEGKHVRLNKVDEVGTLLDRLVAMTEEAKAKGEKAPDFDLCRVSVGKTNLFCAQSKGIPRINMPQLGGVPVPGSKADAMPRTRGEEVDILPEFRKALESRGIKVTDASVLANSLKATQNQLIGPKVAGISKAMETAPPDSGLFAPIFVTRDGYVLDGHHRWAASVARDARDGDLDDIRMNVMVIDMEIGEALAAANAFAAEWGIPQQGFTGAGFTGKLLPGFEFDGGHTDRPRQADVGKGVTIRQDGEVFAGTIIRVGPTGSATIKLPDGTEKIAWPDQIETVIGTKANVDQIKDRLKKVAEIAKATEKATGIRNVSFSGMTAKGAEEVSKSIEELMREWPGPEPTGMAVGDVGTAFAMTDTSFDNGPTQADSKIIVSDAYARDPKVWVKDMQGAEDRGHFHAGTADAPEDYTIDHEFGHVLSFNLFGHPGTVEGAKARAEVMADMLNALPLQGHYTADNPEEINRALSQPFTHLMLKQDLSGYATTSYEEMVAEAFAVYRDHGPGTSAVADAVMRRFVRAYRKKYGRSPDERNLEALFTGEPDQREILEGE